MKNEDLRPGGLMYVKFPRYVGGWLRVKYRSPRHSNAQVRLPEMVHPAGRIIFKHLIPNPSMRALAIRCVSADMFALDAAIAPDDIRKALPREAMRGDYVSVALPKPHFYMGRWIGDDSWMQLGAKDTADFTRMLELEFWADFDAHSADMAEYCRKMKPHKTPVFYDIILDFMELYHIDIDDTDALYRAAKRRKEQQKTKEQK